VRCYTTKAMKGRTLFKCTRCEHSVTTRQFQSTNGNQPKPQWHSTNTSRLLIAHRRHFPVPLARLAFLASNLAIFSTET
jgi:hypothetical protein